ncbi:MAG: ribosomal protein S18-alanine N-acetyltransferase [bacterium]
MTPLIRFMSVDDIDQIVAADRRILGQSLGAETIRTELAENPFAHYFVMETETTEELLGHAGLWIDPPLAQIINIYIVPEQQRHGLGSVLMQYVLDYLKRLGVNTLTLEVRPTNAAAQGFYRAFGFQKVSVRRNYYENGEDADLMLLNIK